MSLWVQTANVGYVSGWVRVDGSAKGELLAFDNMRVRKLEGINDWTRQEIVLGILEESTNIGFGVIFSGQGKNWVAGKHITQASSYRSAWDRIK